MFRWVVCVVGLACVGSGVLAAPAPGGGPDPLAKSPPPCFGLLVAAVRGGVANTLSSTPMEGNAGVRLWEAPLRPGPDAKPEGTSRTFTGWWYAGGPLEGLHWRIAHGHIWAECGFMTSIGASHLIPLEDLPLLDVENAERGLAELRKKYGDEAADNAYWFQTGFPAHTADTLRPLFRERLRLNPAFYPRIVIDYDFLPTGPKSWDGFVLYESKLTVYRCALKPRVKAGPRPADIPLPVECEKCAGPFEAGFQEPFLTFGESGSPFLVTRSGKVFRCLYPEKGEPRVVKVWDDPKRPVTTILNDVDTNRTFVAGNDGAEGAGRRFYFELADRPERLPYDPAGVTADAPEPLKPALLFARFLLKEGKLKDKAP